MTAPAGRPFVRPARTDDLDALMDLAALTGGGMTNLPHDRDALAAKVERSERAIAAAVTEPDDEYYMLVAEDGAGRVTGTACLFSRLGVHWPFYSYKLVRTTHVSRDLGRTFSTHVLVLVNDFDGASEVGGLFLHPDARSGGMGNLLARSRYMFIACHRARFGKQVVAELRGWVEGDGDEATSPFWDAVPGPFFGKGFHEADLHNAIHGNQFIADLMPRYPIYVTMLPQPAQQAIGRAHANSVPAMRLLEAEGFEADGYCDIFDGGPTLHVRTDAIRTIAQALRQPDGTLASNGLAACGEGAEFRCWRTA